MTQRISIGADALRQLNFACKQGHPAASDEPILRQKSIAMADQNQIPAQEDIAALAQKFWEEEGQPEGKAEEHWQRAQAQLSQNQSSDAQARFEGK